MVAGVVVSNVNRDVRSPAEIVERADGPNPIDVGDQTLA